MPLSTPDNKPLITLLTDFGQQDGYVGSMKGIILGINPQVNLVDLSHDLPPQDVAAGAFMLQSVFPYFPPGTIHLAVVDPGVGTSRHAVAVRCREQYWVGPDNGLFHLIINGRTDLQAVILENPAFFLPEISATFHGRDIFAPVAAHLSRGVSLSAFGPPLASLQPLDFPQPAIGPESIKGGIIYVDHFGNLVSNIRSAQVEALLQEAPLVLQVGRTHIRGLVRTYAEAPAGELIALAGSHGYLEIACVQGNAAQVLQAGRGTTVEISLLKN
jgi:S-adenosyl-L-methionine hydrolase (adenosine-forming)